jgi:hypothetical protein
MGQLECPVNVIRFLPLHAPTAFRFASYKYGASRFKTEQMNDYSFERGTPSIYQEKRRAKSLTGEKSCSIL